MSQRKYLNHHRYRNHATLITWLRGHVRHTIRFVGEGAVAITEEKLIGLASKAAPDPDEEILFRVTIEIGENRIGYGTTNRLDA